MFGRYTFPMVIRLDEASLLAVVFESILFGLLTALFATTVYILVFRKRHARTLNKPVLCVSILMYCISISHISINARRVVYAFINLSGSSESADDYFLASANPLYLAKISMYILQTLTGDAFIIYRLYMVWGRYVRLLLPAVIFLLGSTACGTMALVDAARVSPTTLIFIPKLKQWIVSFFSLTLFTNLTCTALIAFKIWWTGRQLQSVSPQRVHSPVLAIVVESGMVYSTALISLMAAYVSGSWGHYVILDMMAQIIAITFSLIIVRIGMGISASNITLQSHSARAARGDASCLCSAEQQYPMHSLVVHLESTRSVKDDQGNSLWQSSVNELDPVKANISASQNN